MSIHFWKCWIRSRRIAHHPLLKINRRDLASHPQLSDFTQQIQKSVQSLNLNEALHTLETACISRDKSLGFHVLVENILVSTPWEMKQIPRSFKALSDNDLNFQIQDQTLLLIAQHALETGNQVLMEWILQNHRSSLMGSVADPLDFSQVRRQLLHCTIRYHSNRHASLFHPETHRKLESDKSVAQTMLKTFLDNQLYIEALDCVHLILSEHGRIEVESASKLVSGIVSSQDHKAGLLILRLLSFRVLTQLQSYQQAFLLHSLRDHLENCHCVFDKQKWTMNIPGLLFTSYASRFPNSIQSLDNIWTLLLSKGWTPNNTDIYNHIIKYFLNYNQTDVALTWWFDMQSRNLLPDRYILDSVVSCHLERKDFTSALKIFREYLDKVGSPLAFTVHNLVAHCIIPADIAWIMTESIKRGFKPDYYLHRSMYLSALLRQDAKKMRAAFSRMKMLKTQDAIEIDLTKCVCRYLASGKVSLMDPQLILRAPGIKKEDLDVFKLLICHFIEAGHEKHLNTVLMEFEKANLEFDTPLLSAIIRSCWKVGNKKVMDQFMEKMKQHRREIPHHLMFLTNASQSQITVPDAWTLAEQGDYSALENMKKSSGAQLIVEALKDNEKNPGKAQWWFDRLQRARPEGLAIQPNAFAWSLLLRIHSHESSIGSFSNCIESIPLEYAHSALSYSIELLVKKGRYEEVEQRLQAWIALQRPLNPILVTQLMESYTRSRRLSNVNKCWNWLLHDAGISSLSIQEPLLPPPVQRTLKLDEASTCVYMDAVGRLGTMRMLNSTWKMILKYQNGHASVNQCTSYLEALFRLKAFDQAEEFVFGAKDGEDVVSKYGIEMDEKFLSTFLSFYKSVHPDPSIPLKRFKAKWPGLEIVKNIK